MRFGIFSAGGGESIEYRNDGGMVGGLLALPLLAVYFRDGAASGERFGGVDVVDSQPVVTLKPQSAIVPP